MASEKLTELTQTDTLFANDLFYLVRGTIDLAATWNTILELAALNGAYSQTTAFPNATIGKWIQQQFVNVKAPPYNAKGDGSTDDSSAFNAALATGYSVFVPNSASYYRVSSSILFSSVIGQRLVGEGQNARIVADSSVAKIIDLGGRSQQVENLTISGAGIGSGQSAVYIGPFYHPYWKCLSLLIDSCAIGIENKCPSSNPAAYGSDAGGIMNCQLSTCGIGYLAYGNQDSTPVVATSFSGCTVAGIKTDAGGGANVQGGVFGGCGQAVIVGNASVAALFGSYIEMDDSVDTGPAIDLGVNAIADVISCRFNRGNFTGYDIRTATGATAQMSGFNPGMASGRLNGTSWIRDLSRVPILVNYNGVWDFRAGAYSTYDSLPVAASAYAGQTAALIGSDSLVLKYCKYLSGSYSWVDV